MRLDTTVGFGILAVVVAGYRKARQMRHSSSVAQMVGCRGRRQSEEGRLRASLDGVSRFVADHLDQDLDLRW